MSKDTDLLAPVPFSFEGERLDLLCNGEVEIAFVAFHEMYAHDKIERKRKELGNTYLMHMRMWQDQVAGEEFEWTGYTSLKFRDSEAGKKGLLRLMMLAAGGVVTPAKIDRIFRCPEKVVELFNEDVGDDKPPLGLYWKAIAQGRPTSPAPNTPDNATPQ